MPENWRHGVASAPSLRARCAGKVCLIALSANPATVDGTTKNTLFFHAAHQFSTTGC
jgi:hypothetical protein